MKLKRSISCNYLFLGIFIRVAHSRTASAVISLSIGHLDPEEHDPESKLGLWGTRTQTDGTGAICGFTEVLLLIDETISDFKTYI